MTRKHFVALAKAVATLADAAERKSLAEALATVCASQNERFDRDKFMAACGA